MNSNRSFVKLIQLPANLHPDHCEPQMCGSISAISNSSEESAIATMGFSHVYCGKSFQSRAICKLRVQPPKFDLTAKFLGNEHTLYLYFVPLMLFSLVLLLLLAIVAIVHSAVPPVART